MKRTITLLFIAITSIGFAQQKVTDDELNKFAEAFQQVRMINQSSQQKMMKAVTDEDLTVERFNLINQAEQDPNKEIEASADELEKYQAAIEAVENIQESVQTQLQSKIKASGLSLERFQQIANQLRNDQELQQRLSSLMQG